MIGRAGKTLCKDSLTICAVYIIFDTRYAINTPTISTNVNIIGLFTATRMRINTVLYEVSRLLTGSID